MASDSEAAIKQLPSRPIVFDVGGLDCADCARNLERALGALPGVTHAEVQFATAKARLRVSEPRALEDAARAARDLGFALITGEGEGSPRFSRRAILTGVAAVLLLAGWGLGGLLPALPGHDLPFALPYAAPAHAAVFLAVALGGFPIFRAAFGALRRRMLTVDVLVTLAVSAAVLTGEAVAAAQVVILMSIGQLLEERTVARTRRAIKNLLDLAPRTVTLVRDGVEREVSRDEVRAGDRLLVRPGGRVAIDGTVIEGRADVSEAPITGEARLVPKGPGDRVFAGSLTEDGALLIEADQVGPDTTLARIGAMIEDAQSRQAPVQRLVDRFAAVFIPITLAAAVLVYIVTGEVLRSVTILIGACPCALVLATPVAMFASIGTASRQGLLVKGGLYLERLGRIRQIAFDKTGTLTSGRHEVRSTYVSAQAEQMSAEGVLRLAAAVEAHSEHPVGRAIAAAARAANGGPIAAAADFRAEPGCGVSGTVDGQRVTAGNRRWLAELDIPVPPDLDLRANEAAAQGLSLVYVALGDAVVGLVVLSDALRPEAAAAIAELRGLGIRTHLLSGDVPAAAARVAHELGIDMARGGMLPGDKVAAVAELNSAGEGIAMVGDGINDAPALAAAGVGIAVGRTGSDLAIEAADVILLSEDLRRVPAAVRLGRRTLANIRFNIALSGAAVVGLFVGAAWGWVGPVAGALVHEGSALLVTFNAMRLLRVPAQEAAARSGEHRSHEHKEHGSSTSHPAHARGGGH